MKSPRVAIGLFLIAFCAVVFAQSEAPATPKSEAQQSFDTMKTLAGNWEGPVTVNPPMPGMDDPIKPLHVTMRVTSRGHVIVHEFQESNTPLDPAKYDHPVTMFYL